MIVLPKSFCWIAALIVFALSSCNTTPDKRILQYLNTDGFGNRYTGNAEEENYVAIGDSIGIDEPVHEELRIPHAQVDIDGTVLLPELGAVLVAGLTRSEIEALLMEKYSPYFDVLDIKIRITATGKKYFVFGEVEQQGEVDFKGDLTIFEAVMRAQPKQDSANLGRVRLITADPKDQRIQTIDIGDILTRGDSTFNVHVQERDIIYVPPTMLAQIGYFLNTLLFPVKIVLENISSALFAYDRLAGYGNYSNYGGISEREHGMAVQIETQGQLQEFLGILKRRRWQVLLPAMLVFSIGLAVAVIIPKKYVAKTQVELRPVGLSISNKEGANASFQIRALQRVKKVVQDLQNREYLALPTAERDKYLLDVLDDIKVTLGKGTNENTNFVTIEYADVQLQWAKDFLRALRQSWTNDVIDRDRNKSKAELDQLRTDQDKLLKLYQREEAELTNLLRDHGLSATQPIPGADTARSEDPVYTRLKANETDRDALQLALEPLDVRFARLQKALEDAPPTVKRDKLVEGVSNAAELREVGIKIIDAEAALKAVKPAHSSYRKLQDDLERLREKQKQLTLLVTKGEVGSTPMPNPEIVALRKQIEELDTQRLEKKAMIARLDRDIEQGQARTDELQEVYKQVREKKAAIQRYSEELSATGLRFVDKQREVEVLASPLSSPFEVTMEVNSTGKATEPNPWLIISFALVAGSGLGLGLALLSEFSRSCFRSVGDISRVMAVPVLGSINTIVTRREAHVRRIRRRAVGWSSGVLIGAILFLTWAWANKPQILSQSLRDAVEDVRSKMR